RALACAVVLDERAEVAAAVVDQPLVSDRGEETGQPKLRHGYDLAPPLEAGERLHHRRDLAQRAGDRAGRLDGCAEPDGNGESRLPVGDRLADLQAERMAASLVVGRPGAQRQEGDDRG